MPIKVTVPMFQCVCCGAGHKLWTSAERCEAVHIKDDQQDRVSEAAEDGTLSDLERTLDHEENTPITGGVDLDDDSVPEPAFRPEAVVDPFDCIADYMRVMGAAITERDPPSPMAMDAVRHASLLLLKLRAHRDHQDRVIKSLSPTTEEQLAHAASVAIDATEKALAAAVDIPNSYVEETHASRMRCPQCAETSNVREATNGETRREGKHTVDCVKCGYEFVIVTSVAYTYTSPAIITDDA